MNQQIKMLDVVALLRELPEEGLQVGQVGTVVEIFNEHAIEVEFTDKQGRTIALLTLDPNDLLVLHYEMEQA